MRKNSPDIGQPSEFDIVEGRRVHSSIYHESASPEVIARNKFMGDLNPDWPAIIRRPHVGAAALLIVGGIGAAHIIDHAVLSAQKTASNLRQLLNRQYPS